MIKNRTYIKTSIDAREHENYYLWNTLLNLYRFIYLRKWLKELWRKTLQNLKDISHDKSNT